MLHARPSSVRLLTISAKITKPTSNDCFSALSQKPVLFGSMTEHRKRSSIWQWKGCGGRLVFSCPKSRRFSVGWCSKRLSKCWYNTQMSVPLLHCFKYKLKKRDKKDRNGCVSSSPKNTEFRCDDQHSSVLTFAKWKSCRHLLPNSQPPRLENEQRVTHEKNHCKKLWCCMICPSPDRSTSHWLKATKGTFSFAQPRSADLVRNNSYGFHSKLGFPQFQNRNARGDERGWKWMCMEDSIFVCCPAMVSLYTLLQAASPS